MPGMSETQGGVACVTETNGVSAETRIEPVEPIEPELAPESSRVAVVAVAVAVTESAPRPQSKAPPEEDGQAQFSEPEPAEPEAEAPRIQAPPRLESIRIPQPEPPAGLEPMAQLLLYDDEANDFRPVRGLCLDVRDVGSGVLVVVMKVRDSVRIRRVVDGAIVESGPKALIAVPAIFDLVVLASEMSRDPIGDELGILEGWFAPIERTMIPGGIMLSRYLVYHQWIKNKNLGTRKDLLE